MSKEINSDGYRLAHTMIRVRDLETSFNFNHQNVNIDEVSLEREVNLPKQE